MNQAHITITGSADQIVEALRLLASEFNRNRVEYVGEGPREPLPQMVSPFRKSPEDIAEIQRPRAASDVEANESVETETETFTVTGTNAAGNKVVETVEAPKRKRRSKAEMEAERAAQAAAEIEKQTAGTVDEYVNDGPDGGADFVDDEMAEGSEMDVVELATDKRRELVIQQGKRAGNQPVLGLVQKYLVEVRERMTAAKSKDAQPKTALEVSHVDFSNLVERMLALPDQAGVSRESLELAKAQTDFLLGRVQEAA